MGLTVRLLGTPRIERDGVAAPPPRGRKAWALLAYLVLSARPVPRSHLADLLFGDADDPLGALRWTLAELRRALEEPGLFRGDPVDGGSGGLRADVGRLAGETGDDDLVDLGGELLEGLTVTGCPAFEGWLVVERHRLSSRVEARMRQAAVGLLAEGRAADAVPFASLAVARNPLDEGNHELLVRCLAGAGDVVAAGAVEAGLDCLHRAVAEAAGCGDARLHARALTALGGALVHGVRGRDDEGAVVLRQALRAARDADDAASATTAARELAFVEVQAGRRGTAAEWLDRAETLAATDEARAAVLGVRAMDCSDRADYPAAIAAASGSATLAARAGDPRQQAWSLSILGRAHLLRGEHDLAADAVARSLRLVEEQRWLAFQPWPRALQAELDLRSGDDASAERHLEGAWSLSCQLGDPCWEGMAARGLALLNVQRDDPVAAARWVEEALRRCGAVTDRYQWVKAYVLDAGVRVALTAGDTDVAARLADTLGALAARCELRELVVRERLHRWRLGDDGALSSARLLARGIENPALAADLADPARRPG
ncbi:SARP family transcriptional regulator [Kineosporia sp. R_H_3]|uniref:AfsR/SARP family transcriptional regulator n=1 Tax=Kineosporia sp. R_H_3 TaxID=1961848 RepID=UPI000B4AF5FD|nr:SARP family transcriptional regulator [Kineosporia sp. R_H_3]